MEDKASQFLNIGVFNVRGYITNEVKKGKIGKTFLRRRLDVCAVSETMLKGRGEVMLGLSIGRAGVGRVE